MSTSTYKQKYKRAWEWDPELKHWLTPCASDAYAAYCRFCRCKLHAHKKGLLAHAKSTKHKKHVTDPQNESLAIMPPDQSFENNGGDIPEAGPKKVYKSTRTFNEKWLQDPNFSQWLRRVPNNNTRALCIACRCVIMAGKCELMKHTKAAKHKKAMLDGPFQEIGDNDLQWLELTGQQEQQSFSGNQAGLDLPSLPYSQQSQLNFRASVVDLPGMLVDEILTRLNTHVPLSLAEKWDNVGVITKPTQPVKVSNILLTIDLNEKIVEEAIKKRVQFIISYHPPIFNGIKSLNPQKSWKDKAILMCIEHKITIYSPHTALDAIKGGINDWLISTFVASEEDKIRPLHYCKNDEKTSCLEVMLSEPQTTVAQVFKDVSDVTMTDYGNSSTDVRVTCNDGSLPEVVEQLSQHDYTQLFSRVTHLAPVPIPGIGMGRKVTLLAPLPLYEVVQRAKSHLDLPYIRLALSPKHTRDTKVGSIAVCAGSGSSVLKGCTADVWITGEMSHHDVLDATNSGVTIILCEHTNTERGFLRDWSEQLKTVVFEDLVMVSVSELDKDPLRIV